ncbi:MAG: hypothetical protein ACUVRE_06890 [Thermoanaerobaculaceae bacterium]
MAASLDTSSLPTSLSLQTKRALLDQLTWVVSHAQASQGLVYFLPSIGWGIASFQRPHHLARAFATLGWTVVFDVTNANDPVFGFFQVEPNIFLFKGPPVLLQGLPVKLVWAFSYNLHQRTFVTPRSLLVYDIIDSLEVFPYPEDLLWKNHRWGLQFADLVTCVSRGLVEEVAPLRKDALYLPNAADPARFDTCGVSIDLPAAFDDFLRRFSPRVAMYIGSLARWFDFSLMFQVVQRTPEWGFVFVGPVLEPAWPWESLWPAPNVFYGGPQPYAFLPFLIERCSVGLIPFAGEKVLRGLSPLKMYEFLAAGKPLVVTPFPEAEGIPGVFMAKSVSEFATQLEVSLKLARELRTPMLAFARRNTWLQRVEAVLRQMRLL